MISKYGTGFRNSMKEYIRKYRHMLIAALLGMLIFLCICGVEPLRFSGIGWTARGFGNHDITQHQTGWMFYRNSPWSFPLCRALFLGYPEGTSVSYTDSIPIAALFFKLLSPILPETFQYFGLYTCFSFIMQGFFAAGILFLLTKDRAYSIAGSTVFVTASCFLERCFRHTALSSHWLILASLYLYFLRKKDPSHKERTWAWLILLCVSLGIHPYLFAMCFAVYTVSACERFFMEKNKRPILIEFIGFLGSCILFGFILGLFGTETSPETGFGQYSLNLNALFNPYTAYHERWSAFLETRDVFPAQKDGMYYLGLPLIILSAGIMVFRGLTEPGYIRRSVRSAPGLFLLLVFCTLFALSDTITFDGRVLLRLRLPDGLLRLVNYFRASARFFFIPYYCIIITALTGLFRLCREKARLSVLCCVILVILQTAETSPAIKDIHRYFETRYEDIYLSEEWNELAERYSTAKTFDNLADLSLAFWMAKKGFRTDLMISAPVHINAYWARTRPERDRLRRALAEGTENLDPDTIYIISEETGTNRSFPDGKSFDEYISRVREAYRGRAVLRYMTDWVKYYWILCPDR